MQIALAEFGKVTRRMVARTAIERAGPTITPQALKTFARTARKRMRVDGGSYRRDHLRALAQRVVLALISPAIFLCALASPYLTVLLIG